MKEEVAARPKVKLIDATTWKFVLVGIINTIVGMSIMFAGYNLLHWGYWTASAISYIIGSIVSFVLNKYFTFQNKQRSFKQVLVFIVNIAVCYFIAYGVAKPVVYAVTSGLSVKVAENLALGLGMVLFVALNYLGQRFIVFTNKE